MNKTYAGKSFFVLDSPTTNTLVQLTSNTKL
jgi:hypothetical protein